MTDVTKENRLKYIIGYNTDDEFEAIIQAIYHHNLPNVIDNKHIVEKEIEEFGEVGEEIENICGCEIKKIYKNTELKGCTKAILCDNTLMDFDKDWNKTIRYLKKFGIHVEFYYKNHKKRINWEKDFKVVQNTDINDLIYRYLYSKYLKYQYMS